MEKAYDPTIRHFVALIGPPDYILVESYRVVKLIYIESERIVTFSRPSLQPSSRISNANGLPDGLVRQLTAEHQARLVKLRRATNPKAKFAD